MAAARTGKAHGAELQVTESLGLSLVSRRDNFMSPELTGLCRGALREQMQSVIRSVGIVLRPGLGRGGNVKVSGVEGTRLFFFFFNERLVQLLVGGLVSRTSGSHRKTSNSILLCDPELRSLRLGKIPENLQGPGGGSVLTGGNQPTFLSSVCPRSRAVGSWLPPSVDGHQQLASLVLF